MINKIFINLLFILITINAHAQSDTLRVLFLGNSYTGVNNLPQITQNLASGANKTLIIDSNTPGGNTLEQHASNPSSLNKIMLGNWDFVVLQEQSQVPTIDPYRFNSMYPAVRRLNDTIKKYNSCANVLMYMTWGRRFGGQQCDPSGANCSPVFVNFSHMQDSLASAYVEIANEVAAYIAPVGIAWQKVLEDTTIVLHTADNSHPNYTGSYLAACVFHAIIWEESPIGLSFIGSLSSPLAAYLQQVADSTVFHANSSWNLDIDKVTANFSFNTYVDSVQFTNQSIYISPASFLWDFGDGNTSNAENPSHTYTSNQSFTVSLITTHCSKSDTIIKTVTINTVGISEIDLASLVQVFPNPVVRDLEIKINKGNLDFNIQLVNSNGLVIKSFDSNGQQQNKLNLASLPSGLYLLKIRDKKDNRQAFFKIVKQ